jgi:predicted nucleic acid-binding Zn ribbon protein
MRGDGPPPPRRRRPSGPDHGPRHVADAMGKVLGRLGGSPSVRTMELVFTRWEEVVGEELFGHLRPLRVDGATLVVGADQPAWATRARMESEHILSRVRELGDTTIQRMEVVIGRR